LPSRHKREVISERNAPNGNLLEQSNSESELALLGSTRVVFTVVHGSMVLQRFQMRDYFGRHA
jgi:hypothetical protein